MPSSPPSASRCIGNLSPHSSEDARACTCRQVDNFSCSPGGSIESHLDDITQANPREFPIVLKLATQLTLA